MTTFRKELIEMLREEAGTLLHLSAVKDGHWEEVKLSREKLVEISDLLYIAALEIK